MNIDSSIRIVANLLKRLDYKQIQYIPTQRIRNRPGREFLIFKSFFFKNNFILFKGSVFQPIYEKLLHKKSPQIYTLYKFFFVGKEMPEKELRKFFKKSELDIIYAENIIACTNNLCVSNYKFIPIDDLIITCSPDSDYDTDQYVYIGEDSTVFYNLLQKDCKNKVNNALEIGCGSGFLSHFVSKKSKNVIAVDINDSALTFTKTNAKINNVNNINVKYSNIYSNINRKFDLIISNPPFVFLPEEKQSRTYAFGGHLGLELVKKIIYGLDQYLNENGTCYMIFVSYITEDGINTAFEMLKEVFKDKLYSVTLKEIDYAPLLKNRSFYKKNKISYSIRCFIKIRKTMKCDIKYFPINGVNKIIEKSKLALLNKVA